MNTAPRYDVMEGVNSPMRVLQWATAQQVADYCRRTGKYAVCERRIGNVLREVTVARGGGK